MGMSSSQARLLTLTARMHDIEHRAQKIEADKLRLANDSRKAYEEYLIALDSKKIQYKSIASNGSVTFRDATMNIMQNGIIPGYTGEHAMKNLFLQNQQGMIMVTPAVAEEFGLGSWASTTSMDDYIESVTGKHKSTRDVYGPVEETDYDKIISFTPIPNTGRIEPGHTGNYNYSPVANIEGVDEEYEIELDPNDFASFINDHNADTTGATEITGSTTSITAGDKYIISTKEGLKKLAELTNSGADTTGTEIILTNEIDMSGITGWTGIENFAGTFDGNGYLIKNLSGTQGLFNSTNNAVVQNVGLEGLNINGSNAITGGLIGFCSDTSVYNCYTNGTVRSSNSSTLNPDVGQTLSSPLTAGTGGLIGSIYSTKPTNFNNVFSKADVAGHDGVGGLIGSMLSHYPTHTAEININGTYATGNVSGNQSIGGLIGYAYNDEDNAGDVTDVLNSYAGGSVSGSDNVGGFFGCYLYWGDVGDNSLIKNCHSVGTVNGGSGKTGAFIGLLYVKSASDPNDTHYQVNFNECSFTSECGVGDRFGAVWDTDGADRTEFVRSTTAAGFTDLSGGNQIPTIDPSNFAGAFMSNIIGALTKGGQWDSVMASGAERTAMEQKIGTYLSQFNDDLTDNNKLWNLNNAIYNYLTTGSNSDVAQKLYDDIMNGTISATTSYFTGTSLDEEIHRTAGSAWDVQDTGADYNGEITIPSFNTIADEVYYSMNMAGYDITQEAVRNYFSQYSTSNDDDKTTMANINDLINYGGNLTDLFNMIKNNSGKYTNDTDYKKDRWTVHVKTTDDDVIHEYGTKTTNQVVGQEEYWDTDDPEIAQAMVWWLIAQRGVIVVTEEQAGSYKYLNNIMEVGEAVLTTFDPTAVAGLSGMSEEEIMSMTDEEYNELMGIVNTNVAVELTVTEVPDEKGLKKAEADYEAKLRLIDRKDRNYDTQLAAVETERNAIKQEMETLKTVIKDNGDRTFKLFS